MNTARALYLCSVLVVTCVDPLNVLCRVACNYEGYDDGIVKSKRCACIDYYDPEDLAVKKIKTVKRVPPAPVSAPDPFRLFE